MLCDRLNLIASSLGCPANQIANFQHANIVLQPAQLAASAAARSCDLPGGPTEIGYGGGKSRWLMVQRNASLAAAQAFLPIFSLVSNCPLFIIEGSPQPIKQTQIGKKMKKSTYSSMLAVSLAALSIGATSALAGAPSSGLPSHAELTAALKAVVAGGTNGGFGLNMWATIVDRDGEVAAVSFSGNDRGDQWPGSRVISAQKANTANAFSLPHLALSTANLYSAVQPGGTLFGLQHSNPVDTDAAYKGPSASYGRHNDPLVGKKIGGVNVFGGGLALYNSAGKLLGAIGVSGDTSCADHIIAWKVRHALNLDNVPAGVSSTGDDNMVHDIAEDANGHPKSASGWGHPVCGADEAAIVAALPTTYPVGPTP